MALLTSNNLAGDNEMAFDFHFPTSKKALIIFTRNPELGKVKTRLAKSVGDESALKIYKFLLKHTIEITENLNVDKYVFYSETIYRDDLWSPDIFRKKLQSGSDLGEKMKNAFDEILGMGYEKTIIIGSDMFDLSKKDLETAFDLLQTNNFVIGPATDGGYYLLGMKEVKAEIFQNKDWGTSTVLEETLKNLKNKKFVLLEERNDIDFYEDIKDIDAFQKFLPPNFDKNFL
ncbi:MAG: TIGR04282 family arsenosugar biosynthesis glycosyltransferase [Aequorivita sp.]|nr:TIGR04282 family arsenosugar biosynthesis glycosyltransferase [Aequorivita sp.]